MLDLGRCGRRWVLGSLVLLGAPLCTQAAQAHGSHARSAGHAAAPGRPALSRTAYARSGVVHTGFGRLPEPGRFALRSHADRVGYSLHSATWLHPRGERLRFAPGAFRSGYESAYRGEGGGVLQCVAFAREDSGIDLSGNAADWWDNASGVYARGTRPEAGSVLSFSANGRMRLGHVAVVARVVDARTVQVDHSHWMGGGVSRDMSVVDVSENNDWSAVRVELGHTGSYGSIYPTHGFIYDRPDAGRFESASGGAPMPVLDAAPRDLRGHHRTTVAAYEEVAESPDSGRGIDLSLSGQELSSSSGQEFQASARSLR